MQVADAIAHILKAEGVEFLFAYPVNPLIEAAAKVDIRTIIVRQERIGLHMADAIGRLSSGEKFGVFCMQSGPGAENAFGGVAQAFGESAPILVIPGGYPRAINQISPNFSSYLNFQHVTKSCEQLTDPLEIGALMRRAIHALRSGRPRPALIEIPSDLWSAEVPVGAWQAVEPTRTGPDPAAVDRAVEALLAAERPLIYAGQGVHYAQAWDELQTFAKLLEAPVTTTLDGKSAFAEDHPLALGSANRSHPRAVHDHLQSADLIFGIGCSFSRTPFGVSIPSGKTIVHATLDPGDINKDLQADVALAGDAKLVLQALNGALTGALDGQGRGRAKGLAAEIRESHEAWLAEWMPLLTGNETPLSPYRVIWDLMQTVDVENTIITHDAGSPRDQLTPFWRAKRPLSYIGWGKTTQLGYGLGLAMGAKLLHPKRLCVNVWGDAAIGFTGMDFETAVRERIPILSVLFNNSSMAIEIPIMPVSSEKYGATDISGHYAKMAESLGGYGERIESPDQIVPAIRRGIAKTEDGVPALLEFITAKENRISNF